MAVAGLHFLAALLVVYFRAVSYRDVTLRLESQGTKLPAWTSWGADLATGVLAIVFLWRGYTRLRGRRKVLRIGGNRPPESV